MRSYLDFEKPVAEIEAKVDELRAIAEANGSDSVRDEAARLQNRANASLRELYASLTPWQKTMVARHPMRPHYRDILTDLLKTSRRSPAIA